MLNGVFAGATGMLAVLSVIVYQQRKRRDLLWLALLAAILVPVSLLGNHYLLVTVPVVTAVVTALAVLLAKTRKQHT